MTVMYIVGVTNLDCHSVNILGYVTNFEGINVYVLDMLAFIIGMLNFVGCVMNFEDIGMYIVNVLLFSVGMLNVIDCMNVPVYDTTDGHEHSR